MNLNISENSPRDTVIRVPGLTVEGRHALLRWDQVPVSPCHVANTCNALYLAIFGVKTRHYRFISSVRYSTKSTTSLASFICISQSVLKCQVLQFEETPHFRVGLPNSQSSNRKILIAIARYFDVLWRNKSILRFCRNEFFTTKWRSPTFGLRIFTLTKSRSNGTTQERSVLCLMFVDMRLQIHFIIGNRREKSKYMYVVKNGT